MTIRGEPSLWRSLGLTVAADGLIPLFGTGLRIIPAGAGAATGIVSWTLSMPGSGSMLSTRPDALDGLSTEWIGPTAPVHGNHELGASSLDHVVVLTPDLERTSETISDATGCELRRVRTVGSMRQGFHRIGARGQGGLVVELVGRPEIPDGPAEFWGVVLIVDDLDAACSGLGPNRVNDPKDAVQPGRRIATVRAEVGLGLPVALMTP